MKDFFVNAINFNTKTKKYLKLNPHITFRISFYFQIKFSIYDIYIRGDI